MKPLAQHRLDYANCRQEWADLDALLGSEPTLDERRDVLPFFASRRDLSLIVCLYFPMIRSPDVLAHEYIIQGDFVADLVVGDSLAHRYLLVEFEDAHPDSIFRRGTRATSAWSPRFEGAYSQLIDWLWKLEDMRSTADFQATFGDRRASFQGLIVTGKNMNLSAQESDRLKWRLDKVRVDSNAVSAISFDDLRDDVDHWLTTFFGV
jgi:hypothetical protein